MADALDLGSSGENRGGSNPPSRTHLSCNRLRQRCTDPPSRDR